MTKPLIILAASLTLLVNQICVAETPEKSVAAEERPINVSYSDVLAQAVKQPNLTLSYGENQFQFGQLWFASNQPEGPGKPLVVFIHGGCWINAFDIKHSYALTSAIAARGFDVWSLEYRRTGDEGGGWPSSLDDVLAGIRFIQSYKDDRVDASKIIISGHSAGGHLALMVGSKLPNEKIKGVVGLAAIADIETYSEGENSCQQATNSFMGGSTDEIPDAYREANPIAQSLHPSNVLLHGSADSIVPISQAHSSDLPVEVVNGAGHFDWIHPQTEAFSLLIKQFNQMANK